MNTKAYTLLVHTRQFPLKQPGETIDLNPAAAKYLEQAGVLAPVPAEGETLEASPPAPKRRKAEG